MWRIYSNPDPHGIDRKGQWEVHFIRNLITMETETDFPFKISTSSVKNIDDPRGEANFLEF
jgi:hypothetical protein